MSDLITLVFDLGGSAIKYAKINAVGEILLQGNIINPTSTDFSLYCETLDEIITLCMPVNLLAFSTPGGFKDGVISGISNLPCIHHFPIQKYFEEKYLLPSYFINDGSAGCYGEYCRGAGRGYHHAIMMVIGSGIGGGLVIDDHLVLGKDGFGGEFGHGLYQQNFKTQTFANFHDFGSVGGVIYRYCAIKKLPVDMNLGKTIFDMASADIDVDAVLVVNDFYDALATLIVGVNYTCDTEVVILSGPVTKRKDFLQQIELRLNDIESKMQTNIKVNLKVAMYPETANLYGAWLYANKQEKDKI